MLHHTVLGSLVAIGNKKKCSFLLAFVDKKKRQISFTSNDSTLPSKKYCNGPFETCTGTAFHPKFKGPSILAVRTYITLLMFLRETMSHCFPCAFNEKSLERK